MILSFYHLHSCGHLNISMILLSKDKEDDSSDNDEVFHSVQAEVQIEPCVPNPTGNEVNFSICVVRILIST